MDGAAEKRSGLWDVVDTIERFCVMSAVPLFSSLIGSLLDPRFLLYTGAVLTLSMRSSSTEAWKLTKESYLLLTLLMLASFMTATLISRLT